MMVVVVMMVVVMAARMRMRLACRVSESRSRRGHDAERQQQSGENFFHLELHNAHPHQGGYSLYRAENAQKQGSDAGDKVIVQISP